MDVYVCTLREHSEISSRREGDVLHQFYRCEAGGAAVYGAA